ncbi:MAG TPA: trans-aconitate 2-methyltransferase [Steroidobacteraceae bacterium]|jgi:trans-aconitate 2-methyltransferase|nr:trans-aconitate 2-methyltransferase [Steroidobacteraceae bacterium]
MLTWNPELYRRYEDERTRPAAELLARVSLARARHVVDLGCGPGNSTELLVRRFPQAQVLGVDNSPAMLKSAAERLPRVRFELADIATWDAGPQRPDLIYANAALQWVPDHERLLPRLLAALAAGGVLAIQMPDSREEPTNRLMRALAARDPWRGVIGDASRARTELLRIEDYYDLLATAAARVEVWHTIYQHPMASAAAIVEWVRATGLRPFVDPLPQALRVSFLAEFERGIDAAYPPRTDGQRLLAFPRLFIVAQARALPTSPP